MLNEPTIEKLKTLNLFAMTAAWLAQQSDPKAVELDFDTRFGLLIEAEALARDNKRVTRLLKDAKLRISNACIEDVDFGARRELDRKLIRQLTTGRWITEHHNMLITGATGVGKTYLACALAQLACRHGFRAAYRRVPRLFDELMLAHADGSYSRLLARLAKVDVLVLDDWGLAPLSDDQRRDILEIIDDRHGARSTIVTSQLPVEKWHDYVGDPTIADAVLDRLNNPSHRITLKGPSRRKENAMTASETDS